MDNIKRFSVAILAFTFSFLVGCTASPTKPEDMTASNLTTEKEHPYSVSVSVAGGQGTNALGKSQISSENFAAAISASILKYKVFERVIEGNSGDYKLNATIMTLDQPSFGMSFTVKMGVAWNLTKISDSSSVWKKVINSEHTATTGDAFVGIKRMRLATEGAAQKNIEQALMEISSLYL